MVGAALVAAVVSIVIRAPYVTTFPTTWDSVLYLRAIEVFAPAMDPHVGQPHPPGYVFYVLAARAAATVLGEPYAGLLAISVIGAALASAAGVILGTMMAGRAVGILCGGLLLANPLLSFYSEIGYPYTLLALLSASVAGFVWWARSEARARLPVAAAVAGVLAGFRQDMVLLTPLGLSLARRAGRRAVLLAAGAFGLGCIAWLVPSAMAVGGVDRYLQITLDQFLLNSAPTGGQSFRENLVLAMLGAGGQIRWLIPFTVIGAWYTFRQRRDLFTFLLWWTVPLAAFYLFAHIGEFGYALIFAAPFALVTAIGIQAILEAAPRGRPVIAIAVVVFVALNTATFAIDAGRFSVDRLRQTQRDITGRLEYVRQRLDPATTAVLAEFWFMHAFHFLPQYRTEFVPLGGRVPDGVVLGADAPRLVVIFDREIALADEALATRVEVAPGTSLRLIRLGPGAVVVRRGQALAVEDQR